MPLRPRTGLVPVLAALALLLTAAGASAAGLSARGSTEEAYVLGAPARAKVQLVHRGRVVASGRSDRLGSKIFRELAPGPGYTVRVRRAGRLRHTRAFRVLRMGENPPQSFYRHLKLKQGLNYVPMRDGVKLAMTVRLPAGKKLSDGPFPTLVEYSGYQTAAPHDLLASILKGGSDPLAPATATAVGSLVAPLLNFAVVSVQMRGSGCSGGAFDLFGLPTTYDGYDAIEATAAQSWSKGKVGMAGISFSGITQLFVAGTRPPHLAAIAPMSVTDDTYTGTGYPGGIFNSGFAKSWIRDRQNNAKPAPNPGAQPYANALVRSGDKQCIANQKLRLQTPDLLKLQHDNPFRTPSVFARRAGSYWLARDRVPTFLIGQFQDEQTSGHFGEMLPLLRHNKNVWITLQNGVHVDSLGPNSITRWAEFLNLFVAHRIPVVPQTVITLSGALYQELASAGADPVLQSRFANYTSVAKATAVFKRDPRVRILMDNGAGPQGLGSIGSTWSLAYSAWPPKQAKARFLYLGSGGALGAKPAKSSTAAYVADPKARPRQTLPGSGDADAWKAQPPYDWAPVAKGKGLGWLTPPLATDTVVAGTSSLDVYLKSSARDTDLQVTLSEVRPDGNETYVQSGWLRASHRKLDAKRSTVLDPVPTHLKADAAPIPHGKYVLVRVPIYPVAHAFRKGSRIRVTITAPGGDRPRWAFASVDHGTTRDTVSLGGARASRLVLPIVPGATAKGTPLPPPTALRGEPNRVYAAASNGG